MYPNFSLLTINSLKDKLNIKFGLSKYWSNDELNFLINLFLNEFSLDFPEYKAIVLDTDKVSQISIKYDSDTDSYYIPVYLLNDDTAIPPIEVIGYIPLYKYATILNTLLPSTIAKEVYYFTQTNRILEEKYLLEYLNSLIFNNNYITFANQKQVFLPDKQEYVYCITLKSFELPAIVFLKVPRLIYQDLNRPLNPKIYKILENFLSWKFLELLTSKNIDLALDRLMEFTNKLQEVYYNQLTKMTDETTWISSVSLGDISVSFKSSLNEINQTGNLLSNLLQAPMKLSGSISKEYKPLKERYERLYKKGKYWYYLGNT